MLNEPINVFMLPINKVCNRIHMGRQKVHQGGHAQVKVKYPVFAIFSLCF